MSNALAIASVTAVLKDLLNNGLVDHDLAAGLGQVKVSALPPDRVIPPNTPEASQLNLFLYQVSPNAAWCNHALPSRDAQGTRVSNPPLALDLHYLLTAYGAEEFHAEVLLGYAMQLLHETPFLTRDAIRSALAPVSPVGGGILPPPFQSLPASDLAEQVEQIKISPQSLNTEEMSRLWTALQAHYRPTAAYQVSVVLIEARRRAKAALPVRERKILVKPLARPVISEVRPQVALPGATLTILGHNLSAELTRVEFGTGLVTPSLATESELQVTPPAGLQAGVRTVQVKQLLDFGTPNEPHRGFDSNIAAFVLAPRIVTAAPPPQFSVARGATLTLPVEPAVGRAQAVALLIDEQAISIPARPASGPATATSLDFPIPADSPTGTFLLRLRVDGADSPLDVDTLTGEYVGPKVTVT